MLHARNHHEAPHSKPYRSDDEKARSAPIVMDDALWKELQKELASHKAVTAVAVHEITQKFLAKRRKSGVLEGDRPVVLRASSDKEGWRGSRDNTQSEDMRRAFSLNHGEKPKTLKSKTMKILQRMRLDGDKTSCEQSSPGRDSLFSVLQKATVLSKDPDAKDLQAEFRRELVSNIASHQRDDEGGADSDGEDGDDELLVMFPAAGRMRMRRRNSLTTPVA